MINKNNKRVIHKEPTETEFKAFKREFLAKKSVDYYDKDTKRQLQESLLIIGKLQSHISELEHKIERQAVQISQKQKQASVPNCLFGKLNKAHARQWITEMMAELLYQDLKQGNFYQ